MKRSKFKAIDSAFKLAGTLAETLNAPPSPEALGFNGIYLASNSDPVFAVGGESLAANDAAAGDRLRAPLQTFVVSAAQNDPLEPECEFLSPSVDVSGQDGYFSYTDRSGGINTLTDLVSIERAINGAPVLIDGNGVEVAGFCKSYALGSEIDEDRTPNVQLEMQTRVQEIMDLISLHRLKKKITAMVAIATNSDHTWGSSANPDGDLRTKINLTRTASGFQANRAYFDSAAWALRQAAYEAQATAAAFQGTMRNEAQLASYLQLSGLMVSKAIAKDSAGTLAALLSSKVLLFRSFPGATRRDTSILKTFYCNDNGQRFRVHQRQISEKVWRVAVTYREIDLVTGPVTGNPVRQMTIS